MKALVWEAPRKMSLREQEIPEVEAEEVLIRVAFAGICGSELSGYLGHNALRTPPLVMGHEFSGEVAEVGKVAAENYPDLRPGVGVTVNPLYCEGESELQRRGLDQLCPSRRLLGAHRPGAYAEYVTVPAKTITRLPDGMDLRTGALTEPVACGVRIGELAGEVDGEACLIIGAGPIGLLALQALKLKGADPIFIADLDPERLEMGQKLGGIPLDARSVNVGERVQDETGGAAVAVDAVGTAATRTACVVGTRPTGLVVLSGLHEEESAMPVADIIRREIRLQGSFAYSPANFSEAITRLARGEMGLEPWIVEAPLADGGDWFDRLIDHPGNVSKVLLLPTSSG